MAAANRSAGGPGGNGTGVPDDGSTPPPGSAGSSTDAYGIDLHAGAGGARRRAEDDFSKYVERAVSMFQSRKEMKEKRIKRSTLGLTSGSSSLTSTPMHNGGAAGSASGHHHKVGALGNHHTHHLHQESPDEYQDSIEQGLPLHQYAVVATASAAANDGVQNPLSPTPNVGKSGSRRSTGPGGSSRSASALLNQTLAQGVSGEKRYLNPTDIYGSRKKFKTGYDDGMFY